MEAEMTLCKYCQIILTLTLTLGSTVQEAGTIWRR